MEILALILNGMIIACFVTLVVVPVTLARSGNAAQPESVSKPWSALGWIIGSAVSFGVWAILLFYLLMGHSGNIGFRGLVGDFVLFAGPALYIYMGFRTISAAKSRQRNSPEQTD